MEDDIVYLRAASLMDTRLFDDKVTAEGVSFYQEEVYQGSQEETKQSFTTNSTKTSGNTAQCRFVEALLLQQERKV